MHTMGFIQLSKEEILTYVTTWMSLEDIMLSEINQSQKDKYYMIPFLRDLEQSKIRGKKQNGGCQGLRGEENGQLSFTKYKVSFLQDEKSSGDGW